MQEIGTVFPTVFRNSKSKFLSVSSMNTLLAILKVTVERRRYTGRRTVPQISLETPSPPLPVTKLRNYSETKFSFQK